MLSFLDHIGLDHVAGCNIGALPHLSSLTGRMIQRTLTSSVHMSTRVLYSSYLSHCPRFRSKFSLPKENVLVFLTDNFFPDHGYKKRYTHRLVGLSSNGKLTSLVHYYLSSTMAYNTPEILSWTNKDPRESQLFTEFGVLYRFAVRLIFLGCNDLADSYSDQRRNRWNQYHHSLPHLA